MIQNEVEALKRGLSARINYANAQQLMCQACGDWASAAWFAQKKLTRQLELVDLFLNHLQRL